MIAAGAALVGSLLVVGAASAQQYSSYIMADFQGTAWDYTSGGGFASLDGIFTARYAFSSGAYVAPNIETDNATGTFTIFQGATGNL